MEVVSAVIAGVALVVSVIVFVDSRVRELRAAKLARRPALVFSWDEPHRVWVLSNIGSGPALDVVIVQRVDGRWAHPLRMPEMAVQDANTVPRRWFEQWHPNPGLGASYRSIGDERYATRTGDDRSEIREGTGGIGLDAAARIEPHWQYRDG
ncbi:MAG TPA: hypothetical protein VHK02_06795 [Actinomycetota bacterium]|nr:hypothetical protein [Actinomycetota bacterium]